jgi:hypothetical protein
MWLCETPGPLAVVWASPKDMTGRYGLTQVKCSLISASPPMSSNPGLIRSLQKIWRILEL